MAVICAIPYNFEVPSFYFSSAEEYARKYAANFPTEEYELDFIDGTEFESFIARKHFKNSNDVEAYFELIEEYEDSITEESFVALEYLFEYEDCDVETGLKKIDDVVVFEGTAKGYAIDLYEYESTPYVCGSVI